MKSPLASHSHEIIVFLIAIIFFAAMSYFVVLAHSGNFLKFSSPDESANYFFSRLYAETGNLTLFEPRNLIATDLIHTRSIRSDYGVLKPVSFLGLPLLYGSLGALIGVWVLPYLTPFLASLGILFFYFFLIKIFDKTTALVASFFLAVFPIYGYYTAHALFHNVPFFVFFIAGMSCAVRMADTSRIRALFFSGAGGIFFGLALAMRTSEALWLIPTLLLCAILYIRKIGVLRLALGTTFLVAVLSMIGAWNTVLYGSPLAGGYPGMNESIAVINATPQTLASSFVAQNWSAVNEAAHRLKEALFPLGLNGDLAFRRAYQYGVLMFPWLALLAALGFLLRFRCWREHGYTLAVYGASVALFSIILILYYGSWTFYENQNAPTLTVGNSYLRYWLPIYAALLPFAAFCICAGAQWVSGIVNGWLRVALRTMISAGIIGAIAFVSLSFLLNDPGEGLLKFLERQERAREEYSAVLQKTEERAIIITRYHDKLFFPERSVIVGSLDIPDIVSAYAALAQKIPLYYYNFAFSPEDIHYLNTRRLARFGLEIEPTDVAVDRFRLYRLRTAQ
ncbi:glycosyltransferase family 39 protein [Candidatus Uhrbacteria bacterium]|nr:glycosyltransferase family 39 protein [Candidatus Uhrbacteria bacterium]